MHGRRHPKNPHAEAEQFRRRAVLGFVMVVLCLVGLGGWYFKLQVLDHEVYATRSEANRIKPRPVVPGRGMIYDRSGRLLAENVPAFRLDVTPDKVENMETMLAALGKVIPIAPEDLERFNRERKARRSFLPGTLKLRMSDEEMARFAVERWRFPGVELEPYLTRRYPYGPLFAHIIGYVGRIDEKDLAVLGEGNAALTHMGKSGLERYYEQDLRGQVGYEQVETNVQGRAIRTVGRVAPQSGADLRLSVDADLQRAMVAAFGEHEGAAIAMDPRTGEILGMVSLPSYDPNLFVNGISHTDFKALNDNPSRPQFNRLVLGGVAPGSTLKPLIALAGLDSGLRRRKTACSPPACSICRASAVAGAIRTVAGMAGPICASRSPSRSIPITTAWRWTWASTASTTTWANTASASPPGWICWAKSAASCRRRPTSTRPARSAGTRATRSTSPSARATGK